MPFQRTLLARASLSALASLSSLWPSPGTAQTASPPLVAPELPPVVVKAQPFAATEEGQILLPAKVLAGDELRHKLGSSLGDTLSQELGVSASGFGAGASRPVIRGLEGSRVKILSNGMGVADVSALSNDHAVGIDAFTARQIEILRGPAALLYGSGAIGGLVNVVSDRIPTTLEAAPTGEAELRYSTVDKAGTASVSADGAVGQIGLHADGSVRDGHNHKIPGPRALGEPGSTGGTLPWSYARHQDLGLGLSYIQDWGRVGASIGHLERRYGNPTEEGSQIDLTQTRYDMEAFVRAPWRGIESVRVRLGYTDYEHTELDVAGAPEGDFTNRALETRWEATHGPVGGWQGTFGIHTERSRFAALESGAHEGEGDEHEEHAHDTVPRTRSSSVAAFIVEEKDIGPVRINAGLRVESVKRRPEAGRARRFDLTSWSAGGLWAFSPGYSAGLTLSVAERAPATEELYAQGPHHATETFDVGDARFRTETSHNLELTLQKTTGRWRWKANVFHNQVKDFIYGELTGNLLDDEGQPGDELRERIFRQADATIRGAEAEVSWNLRGPGLWARAFADTSRATLDDAGNLPLQPVTRIGADVGWRQGPWRTSASLVHAKAQDRLAAGETSTPSYTRLDASVSWAQRLSGTEVTWFLLARNLLDEDIRLSTSVLKDTAPQPGRGLVLGVRTRF